MVIDNREAIRELRFQAFLDGWDQEFRLRLAAYDAYILTLEKSARQPALQVGDVTYNEYGHRFEWDGQDWVLKAILRGYE